MIRAALAVGALAAALTACGGGSTPVAKPSLSPSPVATSGGGTGLIADVDRATVVAVCINMKEASQIVGTGLANDQARLAIVDAISQLSKPPHPTAALKLLAVLRRDVRRHNLSAAVAAGLKWCTQHGA